MDNYDIVVYKTVKDLFKSNTLGQILKYKNNKEKELISKQDDMKKLILSKYPFLIKSLTNLEEIYSNIPNLELLRKDFQENAKEIKQLDENENLYSFNFSDENLICDLDYYINKSYSFDEEIKINLNEERSMSKIEDKLFACWEIINQKDIQGLNSQIENLDKLITNYICHKFSMFKKENLSFYDSLDNHFTESVLTEAESVFLNEFKLINQEFFNLTIHKILTDKISENANNYKYSFQLYLKFLFNSIFIKIKIEEKYFFFINNQLENNRIDVNHFLNNINNFCFNSDMYRKIIFYYSESREDILNMNESDLDAFKKDENEKNSEKDPKFSSDEKNKESKDKEKEKSNEFPSAGSEKNQILIDPFLTYLNERFFKSSLFPKKDDKDKHDIFDIKENYDIQEIFSFNQVENDSYFKIENDLLTIENKCGDKINDLLYGVIFVKCFEIFFKISCFKIQKFFNRINNYIFDFNFSKKNDSKENHRREIKKKTQFILTTQEMNLFQDNYCEYITNLLFSIYSITLFNEMKNINSSTFQEFYSSLNFSQVYLNNQNMQLIKEKLFETVKSSANFNFNLDKKYNFWCEFINKINGIISFEILNKIRYTNYFDNNSNFFDEFLLDHLSLKLKNDIENEFNSLYSEKPLYFGDKLNNFGYYLNPKISNENMEKKTYQIEFLKNFLLKFSNKFHSEKLYTKNVNLEVNKLVSKLGNILEETITDHLEKFIEVVENINKKIEFVDKNSNMFYLNTKNFELFLDKEIFQSFKDLNYEKILSLLEKLSTLFIQLKLKSLDLYLEKSSRLILLENFENNQNDKDKLHFSSSLFSIIDNLKENFNFSAIKIIINDSIENNIYSNQDQKDCNIFLESEKYIKMNIKLKILNKLIEFYIKNFHITKIILVENKKGKNEVNKVIFSDSLKSDVCLLRILRNELVKIIHDFESKNNRIGFKNFSNYYYFLEDHQLTSDYFLEFDNQFSISIENYSNNYEEEKSFLRNYFIGNKTSIQKDYMMNQREESINNHYSRERQIKYSKTSTILNRSSNNFSDLILPQIKKEIQYKLGNDKQVNKRISNFFVSKQIHSNKTSNFDLSKQTDENLNLRLGNIKQNSTQASTSSSSFNSSKLFDFKIDESYLSLKTSTANNITPTTNLNISQNGNQLHVQTSIKTDNSTRNLNDGFETEKVKKMTSFVSEKNENTNTNQNTSNALNSSLIINMNVQNVNNTQATIEQKNSSSHQSLASGYFNYLNFFSGKIKENLNNLTTGLGINQVIEQNANQQGNAVKK